jgi:2-methylcitrate dehydratase PrpD
VIQAAQRLRRRTSLPPDEIETVTVRTFPLGKTCPGVDNPGPFEEIIQAQMSNQFVVAAVLLDGELTLDHLLACSAEPIARLARRVQVVVDDEATRVFPGRKAGGVRVTLKGGRVEEEWLEDLAYPTQDDVERKFHAYARRVFDGAHADRLFEAILGLDLVSDAATLGRLLRR